MSASRSASPALKVAAFYFGFALMGVGASTLAYGWSFCVAVGGAFLGLVVALMAVALCWETYR